MANIREKVVGHVFDLLFQKPEQEQFLLSQLVNKLGDPVKRVASKAALFLLKLCKFALLCICSFGVFTLPVAVNHHVNMKAIVATEISYVLHRPNISPRTQ